MHVCVDEIPLGKRALIFKQTGNCNKFDKAKSPDPIMSGAFR